MKLNKKYFLATLTAFGMQLVLGVNLANSACEAEDDMFCKDQKFRPYDECYQDARQAFLEQAKNSSVQELREEYKRANDQIIEKEASWRKNNLMTYHGVVAEYAMRCKAKAILDSPDLFKNAGSKMQSKTESNQQSDAGKSPSQSSSSASQNKQNYQAAQIAHNQANAGKGKKRNAQAEVPECIKSNANQTHFKNGCNFAVNFSYCFSGENNSGASSAAKQLLSDLNCNNQQFANTELSAGEEVAGDYIGLNIAAMVCKSPSQPLDMNFDGREALGRCSF